MKIPDSIAFWAAWDRQDNRVCHVDPTGITQDRRSDLWEWMANQATDIEAMRRGIREATVGWVDLPTAHGHVLRWYPAAPRTVAPGPDIAPRGAGEPQEAKRTVGGQGAAATGKRSR